MNYLLSASHCDKCRPPIFLSHPTWYLRLLVKSSDREALTTYGTGEQYTPLLGWKGREGT
jgi:hypothetical protein